MMSLRRIYQAICLRVARPFRKRKNIVFYCGGGFHIPHLQKVILELCEEVHHSIYVVCPSEFDPRQFPDAFCVISTLDGLPKSLLIDVIISTEVNAVPYFFCGISIYFGHGIGPKMSYQLGVGISQFNYIFSPCKYFSNEYKKVVPQERVIDIGLPILDDINLRQKKNVILYAPSWCDNDRYVSNVNEICRKLSMLTNWRVIVSPHPRLLEENGFLGRDSGEEGVVERIPHIEYLYETEYETSFGVLSNAAFVVGEISSIVFEALAFDIPIVFDGNTGIYRYCGALSMLPDIENFTYSLKDIQNNIRAQALLQADPKRGARKDFTRNYFLNTGRSTREFTISLLSLANLKSTE